MDGLTLSEPDALRRPARELYIAEDGSRVELDIDGLEYPFVLTRETMTRIRGWLDAKLTGAEAPTATLEDGELPEELSDPADTIMPPFARESDLSRLAALQAYPRQGTQRWRIIGKLAENPAGLTRDELASVMRLSANTVRPRVVELVAGGWIRESDAARPSDAGQPSAVLVLTERAVQAIRNGG